MALTFTFLGCTNHEMVYRVGGELGRDNEEGEGAGTLYSIGGGAPNDMVTDAKARTPLGDFVAQTIPAGLADEYVFGANLDGEHSVPPRLIGEAYLVPRSGLLAWDLEASDGADGNLQLIVTNNGVAGELPTVGSAYLRIRVKHTFDR